jgi:hypothetical protein
MSIPKIVGAQRDFAFGEVDVALKRADEHPAFKAGLRQMSNARLLNSKKPQNRSGRRALYPISNAATRTERITMSPGNVFDIQFAAHRVQIVNAAGAIVATFTLQGNGAALPWSTTSDIAAIVVSTLRLSIYITFGGTVGLPLGMRPQVITWDGVATWSIADFTEAVGVSGQKRTIFYRLSPQNVTMLPSAITGAITLTFNSPIVVAGMVGTRMRYCGRQVLLGGVINSSQINATVIEPLPPSVALTVTGGKGVFAIGDVVVGAATGARGIVTSSANQQSLQSNLNSYTVGELLTGLTSGATGIITSITGSIGNVITTVQLTTATAFTTGENVTDGTNVEAISAVTGVALGAQLIPVGDNVIFFSTSDVIVSPSASATVASVTQAAPQAVAVWDDEVMNGFRGYPAACFVDQFRVGFNNFPQLPGAIGWSAINSPTDLFVAATGDNAIFEIAPDKVKILYVVPGPESSEFVFCDHKIYYIKIDAQTPLVPGNVSFQVLSGDGTAAVQPRVAQDIIFYVKSGGNSVMAVVAPGAYYRPFNTKNLSEYASHLFSGITALAAPNADGTFLERYVYALNGNGSIAVGKYDVKDGVVAEEIGWGPWSGTGGVSWIAANNADVVFTSTYFGAGIVEALDDTQYLDGALLVNTPPAALAPPGGKGPLWFIPSQSVTLMDQVTRMMGTYQIDANGFIIPQRQGGENLASASLVAGQPWTMIVEPFTPDAAPGQSAHQRMFKRRISRWVVYFVNSTGFVMARLFSGPVTPASPPLGTIMNNRRIPAWNQGDNPLLPPPLREGFERARPLGRSADARVAIIKDTPGPYQISEIGIEASI